MMSPVEAPGTRGEPVALAFTDVEGSSALWESDPDGMREALVVHDAALRGCLAAWSGYEVKTEGDAFMCAFPSAREALGWALAAQEALERAVWPSGARLRVRMGVHLGPTWCRPDPLTGRMDYFGPVVNRAARITHAGHGGQVLASAAAWELAGLDDAAAVDLGEHRLRGLQAPERLWQVLPASLADRRFPPLRTEESRVRVSEPVSAMFGREDEIAALGALLASGRLVTVTGAAGVGKSRLAHEVAWRTRSAWPGGVSWCDVSGLEGADAVGAAVAATLDVPAGRDAAATVASALAGRGRSLLVLDNADGLVDLADTVNRWSASGAVVLATSRVLLGVRSERSFTVAPLATVSPRAGAEKILASPAVALLVAKAREASPGFVAGAEEAADLARLVRLLDGLPLAIELAAARMRLLTPGQLAERLGERLSDLDRHGALKAAFDASWEALGPWEREGFAQLSVFEGSFDLDAAEAVLALPPEAPLALDVVQTLVERSLAHTTVAPRAAPRFRVLATLRGFGRARLSDGRAAAEARHEAWFASRPGDADEIPDLRAAVERALQRGDVPIAARVGSAALTAFLAAGPLVEAVALSERLLALPGLDWAARQRIFGKAGHALRSLGRTSEALAALDAALRERDSAALLVDRANLYVSVGRYDEARADLERARPLTPDERGQAVIRAAACVLNRSVGRIAEAAADYPAVLSALERANDARQLAFAANTYGVLCLDLQQLVPARRSFERAIAASSECQDRRVEALGRMNLALVDSAEGRAQRARDEVLLALDCARELGDVLLEGNALGGLGVVELAAGAPDEAERYFQGALAVARNAGIARLEGNLLGQLALCALDRGELAVARERLELAVVRHREQRNVRWEGWTLSLLGSMEVAAGRLDAASEHVAQARVLARQLGLPWLNGVVGAAEARLELASGRPAVAVATSAVEALGDVDAAEKVLAFVTLAEAEIAAGHADRARGCAEAAEQLLRARGLRRPALVVAVGSLRAALSQS